MRLLAFGSRDYRDMNNVARNMDGFRRTIGPITLLIHGDATGADTCAANIAHQMGIPCLAFPADWDDLTAIPCLVRHNKYGRPYNALAGPNRNQLMIDEGKPDFGMGFPGNAGTLDMATRLGLAGIRIWNGGYLK